MKTKKPVFVVEKGIPMPARPRGAGPKGSGPTLTYPFDKMEVTDSLLVPKGQKWQPVYSSAMQYGERRGLRFERRTMADGMRIWRVE